MHADWHGCSLRIDAPRRGEQGFTLIEMVVSLAIVALLATMARPVLEVAATRHREATLRDGLRTLRTAIDAYAGAVAEGAVLNPVVDAAAERTPAAVATASADAPSSPPNKPLPTYPSRLQLLVDGVPVSAEPDAPKRYFLRRLPRDPFADTNLPAADTWGLRASTSPPQAPQAGADVFDVYSRSNRRALDGTLYSDW
jgi:general secretion pathway protein G